MATDFCLHVNDGFIHFVIWAGAICFTLAHVHINIGRFYSRCQRAGRPVEHRGMAEPAALFVLYEAHGIPFLGLMGRRIRRPLRGGRLCDPSPRRGPSYQHYFFWMRDVATQPTPIDRRDGASPCQSLIFSLRVHPIFSGCVMFFLEHNLHPLHLGERCSGQTRPRSSRP